MDLEIQVKARAKQERVEALGGRRYKVWVKAVPEKGRANEAVIALLSRHLGVPRSRLEITLGHTGSNKRVRVLG